MGGARPGFTSSYRLLSDWPASAPAQPPARSWRCGLCTCALAPPAVQGACCRRFSQAQSLMAPPWARTALGGRGSAGAPPRRPGSPPGLPVFGASVPGNAVLAAPDTLPLAPGCAPGAPCRLTSGGVGSRSNIPLGPRQKADCPPGSEEREQRRPSSRRALLREKERPLRRGKEGLQEPGGPRAPPEPTRPSARLLPRLFPRPWAPRPGSRAQQPLPPGPAQVTGSGPRSARRPSFSWLPRGAAPA